MIEGFDIIVGQDNYHENIPSRIPFGGTDYFSDCPKRSTYPRKSLEPKSRLWRASFSGWYVFCVLVLVLVVGGGDGGGVCAFLTNNTQHTMFSAFSTAEFFYDPNKKHVHKHTH